MKKIEDLTLYTDYLKDESLLEGQADRLYFCNNTEEVEKVLDQCYKNNEKVTVQGGLTGICGGGVPSGGTILNVSNMKQILGLEYDEEAREYIIEVQSGILLQDLNEQVHGKKINTNYWSESSKSVYEQFKKDGNQVFVPDPTETLATIGGMVACDASGACSFGYGSVRNYIEGLTIVTPKKTIKVKRGQYRYKDMVDLLGVEELLLPRWKKHNHKLKDVAGVYFEDDMDIVDLFIGSEGLFGIITEVKLRLINEAVNRIGMMLFFEKESKEESFVKWLRNQNKEENIFENSLVAIEYFNKKTLDLAREFREEKVAFDALPEIVQGFYGGIYMEHHFNDEEMFDKILDGYVEAMEDFGLSEEVQWVGTESSDYKRLKDFRHSIPECINHKVVLAKQRCGSIHKIGTDMSVGDEHLREVMRLYEKSIVSHKLDGYIFGHIGDNHLHVNLVPTDYDEYELGKQIVDEWADEIIKLNGSITAEHGVGKLKKELFNKMFREEDIKAMKELKDIFDPKNLINVEVMI